MHRWINRAMSPLRRLPLEGGGRNVTGRPGRHSPRARGRAKSQYFFAFGKATFLVGLPCSAGDARDRLTPTPDAKEL